MPQDTALVWFRRDLRLADQPALHHAVARHARIIPVYVYAPDEEAPWQPGAASRWWLHHALAALADSLGRLGSPLVIRQGDSLTSLRALIAETGAAAVYWTRLFEPAAIARDRRIKEALRGDGLIAESFNAALLFEPWELKTGAGEPYRVFSPMWKNAGEKLRLSLAQGRAPLPAPVVLRGADVAPASLPLAALGLLPTIAWDQDFYRHWQPGEASAQGRAERFFAGAAGHYREQRDRPAVDATSSLSPHLHFGEISPLQLACRAADYERRAEAGAIANAEWYLRELGWREFSHQLLYHYPDTASEPMYPRYAAFPWRETQDAAADLRAWQLGRTGIPIVDAGMRQLWATGWMHNRVRMLVASLLTKNLLISWRAGADWFWDCLVDASLPQNSLGWQWAAGCGADAAPYYRIFNPVLQGEKFDPEGAYVKRWLPELSKLPASFIHKPWLAPDPLLRAADLAANSPYAKPIIDLAPTRERALAAFATIKT